ncbi:hypothetical protein [Natronoglycomyces albus]|uniref:Uncharacterized protein n=1 Tax=Natronoglycomyces albus TaxID=2811108 RepID=A0A895XQ42_9ACTN|nr:hypothetical protein [Natronoglycomyces albus]QSB05489.1 hypothetical protein JQS30_00650 [Natronoglycomyces albus]
MTLPSDDLIPQDPCAGADYLMDEDAVHSAASSLFDTHEDIDAAGRPAWDASARAAADHSGAQLAHPATLRDLSDAWRAGRYRALGRDVEELAMFLAVHVETSVSMDEFTASMFAQHADAGRYEVPSVSDQAPVYGDNFLD